MMYNIVTIQIITDKHISYMHLIKILHKWNLYMFGVYVKTNVWGTKAVLIRVLKRFNLNCLIFLRRKNSIFKNIIVKDPVFSYIHCENICAIRRRYSHSTANERNIRSKNEKAETSTRVNRKLCLKIDWTIRLKKKKKIQRILSIYRRLWITGVGWIEINNRNIPPSKNNEMNIIAMHPQHINPLLPQRGGDFYYRRRKRRHKT